ncbi:MAG: type II toxin-antitoxin system VapC family toxin [Gemmatimonadales bacterium]|jgi:PIN domain nuclease of toxin-antitoxin system
MASLLLDTQALLWWLAGDRRLSAKARKAIGDTANEIFISAASTWEITTKIRIGKLAVPALSGGGLTRAIAAQGFETLAITAEHGERAGSLRGARRDPFDRMLIAQAQAEAMAIVSNETLFDEFGVTRMW